MRSVRIFTLIPAMLLAAGCMTPPVAGDLHRMDKYRPASVPIVLPEPSVTAGSVAPSPPSPAAEEIVIAAPAGPVKAEDATTPEDATATTAAEPAGESSPATPGILEPAGTAPPPSQPDPGVDAAAPDSRGKAQGQRNLSRGDRIMISLRGIPRAEEIKNIIDGLGEVTLPYIGQVRVAGLTPSDAERLIETTYVNRGIYRNINVIVVAEDKVYFVQGEVARQGKFSMSGDVTLLQAITEAGGYTPFANRRNVKIIRGDQVLFYNARDIANGRIPDPVIASDDIIVVLRSVF